jgi:phasin family protein
LIKSRPVEGTRAIAARCIQATKDRFLQSNRKGFQMSNVEQLQQAAEGQSDAAVASGNTVAAKIQAIAAAHADYAKTALQEGTEFIAKLASLKAPGDVIALQSDYAKTSYEAFAAETKKISELYADLAKQAYQPLESWAGKLTPSN